MKLLNRRMTFQLTPLLDLLLIVIFAQFMDVDQKSHADAASKAKAISDVESQAEQLAKERERFEAELARMEKQQEALGDAVSQLFNVPKETIDRALDAVEGAARSVPLQQPISKEQLAEIRAEFARIAKTKGRESVQHVLTFQEMTKRLEIWDINVDQLGQVDFKAGEQHVRQFRFRDKEEGEDQATAEKNFNNRVFDAYKTLTPHGKTIVLILVRFDRKISFFHLRPMMRALPKLVERLQRDSLGATRYEFAVMGDLGFSSSPE